MSRSFFCSRGRLTGPLRVSRSPGRTELKKGVKTHEWYDLPHNAWFDGKVKSVRRGGDTIIEYPGHPGEEMQLDPIEGRKAVDVRPYA